MAAFIYLETGRATNVFHCRGELDATSNPDRFAQLMARDGRRVVVHDELIGTWPPPAPGKDRVGATAADLGVEEV